MGLPRVFEFLSFFFVSVLCLDLWCVLILFCFLGCGVCLNLICIYYLVYICSFLRLIVDLLFVWIIIFFCNFVCPNLLFVSNFSLV